MNVSGGNGVSSSFWVTIQPKHPTPYITLSRKDAKFFDFQTMIIVKAGKFFDRMMHFISSDIT